MWFTHSTYRSLIKELDQSYHHQSVDYTHTVYWLESYHYRRDESTVALLDFAVTKKSFARVNFVVSDEMSLNDCVDRFDEDEFQHNADLFIFVEDDLLQSFHENNFFRNQFWYSRRICIDQRFNNDRYAAIVIENENVDLDRMHQNFENVQLHSDFDIIQSDSLKMLTKKHHVLLLANKKLDVFTAKMLKNQNSILRWIIDAREFS
jgi:hypothetical protein